MLDLGKRLDALIAEPDPEALRELLDGLDGRGRTQAKSWFAGLPELPFSGQARGGYSRGPQRTQRRHHAAPAADAAYPDAGAGVDRLLRRGRAPRPGRRARAGARPRVAGGLRPGRRRPPAPLRVAGHRHRRPLPRGVRGVRPRRARPPGRRDAGARLDGGVHPAARVGRGAVRAGRRGRDRGQGPRRREVRRARAARAGPPRHRRVHHDRRGGGRPGGQRRPRPGGRRRALPDRAGLPRPSVAPEGPGRDPGRPRAPRGRGARRPGPGPAAAGHLSRDRHRGPAAAGPRPARVDRATSRS